MRAFHISALPFLAGVVLTATRPAVAQQDDMCLMCHTNPALFAGLDNAAQFVVNPDRMSRSVHGTAGVACSDCHEDREFPHTPDQPRADCASCHTEQAIQHRVSLHGQAALREDPLAPTCTDCHGFHDVLPNTNPRSPIFVMSIPGLCGECHHEGTEVSRTRNIPQDQIFENYSLSIHGAGLFQQGLTVTAVCTSCHTAHQILPHTDPRSSIHPANVARTCTACHALIEDVHRQVIEGRLWEAEPDKIPACVDCHSPHVIRNVFYEAGAANADCLACHADRELTMEVAGDTVSLYVDEQAYNASEHSGTACAQCHTDVTTSRVRACETIESPADCSICHAGAVGQYDMSTHGTLAASGDPDAPTCLDCHEKHATTDPTLPTSPTFPRNVPDLCAQCHREGEAAARRIESDVPDIVQSYEMSIHGKGLLESGLVVTATCSDCHSAHGELPPTDSRSTVHDDNVAETCGECHHGIEEAFKTSIHWPGNGNGDPDKERPTCENCHTSHTISRTDRSDFRLLMMDQCGNCHTEEAETFFDTFHGKVSRLGDARAAKCYDCHGTHNIHPVTDVRSTLSRRNIVETCSTCHPAANRRFTGYLTHATHHDPDRYPWLFWAFWSMTALLLGTLTFALLHSTAWLWRLWRSPQDWSAAVGTMVGWRGAAAAAPKAATSAKLYRRFTTFQRSLHLIMMISFMTLALTGMALKFSYMAWAQGLSKVLAGFATLGVLHRLGAVTLIIVFLIHLWDARCQKNESGKSWREFVFGPNSMIFNLTDLKEFIQSLRWFLGRGERPQYGRFTYWEKFDYFAVFWGMFIIGFTGLILWFPEFFTLFLPGQTVNVVTIIHSDEALLAVGFIFTVHFFNTHFRLDKFPMDPVIFTGRVPVEELKRDKPREYEQLTADGTLEQSLVDPYPANVERAFKVFGFTMLGIGLLLIFLIVYTMVIGHQ